MTIDDVWKYINQYFAVSIEVAQCQDCGEYVIAVIPGINAYLSIIDGAYKDGKIVCAKCGGKLVQRFYYNKEVKNG